jgi:nitrous oxide reductase
MKGNKRKTIRNRRDFLRGSAIAGAGVAVASSIPSASLASTSESLADDQPAEEGYRLTQHIIDYYKTAAE